MTDGNVIDTISDVVPNEQDVKNYTDEEVAASVIEELMMMSFDELELREDEPYQYINPEVLATEVPKQFFIELKEWINDGCVPYDDEFVAHLGICANLATYMGTEEPEQNWDYWYDYITNLFGGRAYPFGKDGYGVHQYIGSSDIISRRLQFIDYNIAHLPE